MVFIGLRAVQVDPANPGLANWKSAKILHINPHYVKLVNEGTMTVLMDDNTKYRIDDESLQIFLSAMYGENKIRGDKLDDEENLD